jgi:NAD(P) transhydrogenase
MFAALGVAVTVVDARPEILPFLDGEIVQRLRQAMGKLGIRLVQNRRWGEVARAGEVIRVALDDGSHIETADLLFSAGREGRSSELNLAAVGVDVDKRGYVEVDEAYRSSVPNILAAGDVIGFPALASTSMEQGRVAVCRAFGFAYKQKVASMLPFGIYTIPEVSSVGETEQSCIAKQIPHVVGRALYCENARGRITGDLEGITKLVVHADTREVLGVHVIGERATELVHIGQAAIALGGTVDVFIDMVFNFPTLAESYKYAAYECLGALARR